MKKSLPHLRLSNPPMVRLSHRSLSKLPMKSLTITPRFILALIGILLLCLLGFLLLHGTFRDKLNYNEVGSMRWRLEILKLEKARSLKRCNDYFDLEILLMQRIAHSLV